MIATLFQKSYTRIPYWSYWRERDRQLQDEFGNKVRNVLTDLWQLVEETQVMKAGKLLKDKNNGAVYVQSYLILHNPL